MIRLVIFLLSFSLPVVVHAKGDLIASDSALPVHIITSEEIQKIPLENRSIDGILNSTPTKQEYALRKQDIDLAKSNLRANVVLINGRRSQEDPSTIPADMIDRIEVLKDGASAIYGSDAIRGVVNYITKKSFELHPQELPLSTAFKPIEIDWQSKNIALGRIGLRADRGKYAFGLSTFEKGGWSWTDSMPVGATLGLNGPIAVLGKTSLGPGYSIYDQNGAFIGDLNKKKVQADPYVTGQYLLRAGYPELNTGLRSMDRIFTREDFNPYGVSIFPKGLATGDLFQVGDRMNEQLMNFKGYDDSLHGLDGRCTAPYAAEQIYPRSVLEEIMPNDPLYQRSTAKKKGGIPFVGDLLSIGSGVLGVSVGTPVDKEGPAVYDQYSLHKIGFTNKSDPQSAWNLVDVETKNVVVAVIDSGIDMTHPDAPQYIWNNEHEIPGNNIDDDHNGYIDDVHGWNFLDENNDLKDLRGHGTVVAGIIAARSNNGIGIAGINPGAVIMPIKVADKFGNTNSLYIFRAIKYAVSNGAKVINISLGAKSVSALERLAINYARAKGVFVVIASGNDGADMSTFGPSSVPSALAVGAVNFDGTRSTVSNWGANNGLMAPGEEIYSLQSKDAPWEGPSGAKNRQYTKLSGTSFSAPMVAATASLLLVKDPSLNPFDLEDILETSAKKLGEEDWNGRTGAGLLDAANALASIGKKYLNVKITRLRKDYDTKGKKLEAVDVYATVRGDVDHFTVELAKGRNVKKFTTIIGFAGQQAHDDLVAHIRSEQLRGSDEWQVLVRALDHSGKEHRAIISLDLK